MEKQRGQRGQGRPRTHLGTVPRILLSLVIFALLVVALDRALSWYVNYEVSQKAQDKGWVNAQARIHDVPVLKVPWYSRIEQIDFTADSKLTPTPIGEENVKLEQISGTFYGVKLGKNHRPIFVDHFHAQAMIRTEELSKLVAGYQPNLKVTTKAGKLHLVYAGLPIPVGVDLDVQPGGKSKEGTVSYTH